MFIVTAALGIQVLRRRDHHGVIGELTPTLKLKRRIVHAKYADAIDALYTG
jgi:long-subunit acyl-CoA synthetase (AMP-forming)